MTTRFRIPPSGMYTHGPSSISFDCDLVLREPWRMKQVMNRVSKRLDSPECRYLTYCYRRLSELVKENEKKKARAVAKDHETKLRGRLVVAKLLPEDVGDLTVYHLKKATRALWRRQLDLTDLLRLNVNLEQLMDKSSPLFEAQGFLGCICFQKLKGVFGIFRHDSDTVRICSAYTNCMDCVTIIFRAR